MEDIKVNFGKRVKQLRLSKGYSQEKLAEISDLDRTYVPGIEAGRRNVSLEIINKLPKAFEIEMHQLFE
tara:strand:+ start:232 stop:438 length:207 start_codon:yes stop_codon:yes gene_type:complete